MSFSVSHRFFPLASNPSGQTGWIHDHPYVYLLDSTDRVIIGANATIGNEKLRVVGFLRLDDTINHLTGIEFGGGHSLPVSNANEGRIRYNELTQTFEASSNGGAYAPLGAGKSTVYGVAGLQTTDLATFQRIGNFRFNPSDWPATATFTFEGIVDIQGAASVEMQLYNLTTAAVVAGSLLTTALTSPTYLSAVLAMAAGNNDYEVQLRCTIAGPLIAAACGMAGIKIS